MPISLVTGGAGFIGSHIVEALVARGDKVRILDDFSSGAKENLTAVNGKVDVIDADIRDQDAVTAAVKDVELIFHQAAFVSVPLSLQQPEVCFDVNVRGTQNLLEAARGRRIVIGDTKDRQTVLDWLRVGKPNEKETLRSLGAHANWLVAQYSLWVACAHSRDIPDHQLMHDELKCILVPTVS